MQYATVFVAIDLAQGANGFVSLVDSGSVSRKTSARASSRFVIRSVDCLIENGAGNPVYCGFHPAPHQRAIIFLLGASSL